MENVVFFVQSLLAFFIIIDAVGNVPIFISILEKFDEEDKKHIIKRATIIAFLTLLIVTFSGNYIFSLLNTNIHSFSIAGGILLSIISVEMLFGRKSKTETSEDIKDAKEDVSITPLAIPLLTGPGALTTGIVYFNLAHSPYQQLLLVASIIITFILSYEILIHARKIFKFLGKTGTKVVIRIMGLLLLSIAVQFVINGLIGSFPLLGRVG
jgi:multiple antibiotic resistance protein